METPPFKIQKQNEDSEEEVVPSQIDDSIGFFYSTDTKRHHIYAHLEFIPDKSKNKLHKFLVTRIRPTEEIMRILRNESQKMKAYMLQTYDIDLPLHPNHGYVWNLRLEEKWLKGELYGFLCRHYYAYT